MDRHKLFGKAFPEIILDIVSLIIEDAATVSRDMAESSAGDEVHPAAAVLLSDCTSIPCLNCTPLMTPDLKTGTEKRRKTC